MNRNRFFQLASLVLLAATMAMKPREALLESPQFSCTVEETLQCICGATAGCGQQQTPPQGSCWGGK
jgi:hypothetical protein